jgi:hypothetical protein
MGKRSFALGVLTALTAAAAAESTTYTRPTTIYAQGGSTPVRRVVYTQTPVLAPRHNSGTTAVARNAYDKLVRTYDILDNGDIVEMAQDVGLELASIWRHGETLRVSLTQREIEAVEAVITAYALPVTGSPSKLSASFAKAVRYI